MNDFLANIFLNKLTVLSIDSMALYLAYIVYKESISSKINRLYLSVTALMLGWVNFAYLPRAIGSSFSYSHLSLKIAWFLTPLFFYYLYLLTVEISKKHAQHKKTTTLLLALSLIASFFSLFTNKIIQGVVFNNDVLSISYGNLISPLLIIVTLIIAATFFVIIKNWKNFASKHLSFIVGLIIFYVANLIFNIYLPLFKGVSDFYFLGDYSTAILLAFIFFGVIKHQLFNVKVIAAELFIAIILIILFIKTLLSESFTNLFTNIFTFSIVLFLGIILIKSISKEVEQSKKINKLYTQLKHQYKLLETKKQSLETANKKLKALDKNKSDFIAIASHQLRTPLTSIKGFLSMLLEGNLGYCDAEANGYIKKVSLSTDRLVTLVNDLLNISRIERGKIKVTLKKVRLDDIVADVYSSFKQQAKDAKLNFTLKMPVKKTPYVLADALKIRQVMNNFVDNALKYTSSGEVNIHLENRKKEVVFTVTDSGIGLSKDMKNQLFHKFTRAKNVSTIYTEGLGLGLFVAKKIMDFHKGKIWADSKGLNKGSSFSFSLKKVYKK